ncbi:hypothetical protein [Devosia sp.]|uniref:DUF6414 family protein n=1 Tax=Devosia sp. TaxID=1871048 RepID=UPI001A0C4999|nr:hypothetical protein [Devosia sp.]MBE0581883.1 hypothetical protein [Devosia sp.]
MRVLKRLKRLFSKRKPAPPPVVVLNRSLLREFVYLDEVSLRSLLSSQTGGVTDSTSDEITRAAEAEITGGFGATSPVLNAEVGSRYQTSNSSTLQTSRKATVQSWFRELLAIDGLRLIEVAEAPPDAAELDEVIAGSPSPGAIGAAHLRRGELVEFRVKLSADPVFHMSTMVTEFAGMAEDFPGKLAPDAGKALAEVQPLNRILSKLLAGLIPIRGEAVDYRVATVSGQEWLVHKAIAEKFDLPSRHLIIVGVTEHLAYWKDIRRVLFSQAEFTILCRVSRSLLQPTWTPVKLADLFKTIAPDFVQQINEASLLSVNPQQRPNAQAPVNEVIRRALKHYSTKLLKVAKYTASKDQKAVVTEFIENSCSEQLNAVQERQAFRMMRQLVESWVPLAISPEQDLALRQSARKQAVSGTASAVRSRNVAHLEPNMEQPPALLDVEVVAIYW